MKKGILLSLVVLLVVSEFAPAATRRVPDDYDTIQEAIDAAIDGDTVLVADGTYTGPGNRDIEVNGKGITIRSENGPENCIIDCGGSKEEPHTGFYFHGISSNSNFSGFTVTNGYRLYEGGGGILCSGANVTIYDCNIRGNTVWASRGGYAAGISVMDGIYSIYNCTVSNNSIEQFGGSGGISCRNSALTVSNCTINGNSGNYGGGIYSRDYNSLSISNCTFSDNSASYGGGIYCRGYNSLSISNCAFSDNSASYGGGIHCYGSNPDISNCVISGNSADYDGGGIYCEGGSPTIRNCRISGNSSIYKGGGIQCYRSSPIITNCTISGNLARDKGGGINCSSGNPMIINCTIKGNSCEWKWGDGGGGIYCDSGNQQITNCIIRDNTPSEINADGAMVTYCNIKGGWEGQGNIDDEPFFAFADDYHIMPGSACIDAGTNTPVGGLPATDADGNPRALDGNTDGIAVADIGAYEFDPQRPSISLSQSSFSYTQGSQEVVSKTLLIRNCGVGTLNWEIIEDCPWLQVAPTSGTSTGEIDEVTVTVAPNGMMMGYYSFLLAIRCPDAVNNPRILIVNLHVSENTVYVPGHFNTIQEAIEHVQEPGEVIVANGTYTGKGNHNINFYGKAITIRSENGPDNCIIDCQGTGDSSHIGFRFENGEDSNSVLDGFTITKAYTHSDNVSGGIYCQQSSPTITNCIITGNRDDYWAAGIRCDSGSPTITNCTISDSIGRGISFCSGNPKISRCAIIGNAGGGIMCLNSNLTINNSTIGGNWTKWYGSGIYCRYSSNLVVNNCTFVGNSSSNGSALACNSWMPDPSPSSLQLTNCILWNGGNEIWNNDGSTINIAYSDIQGGWEGEGNIDVDPCFADPGFWDANATPEDANDDFFLEGDYHILPDSLCIDAGDPCYVPAPNETDLDGNPRVINSRIDMGAYEANYIQARLWLFPRTINRQSKMKRVMAWMQLPEGVTKDQIDQDTPLLLYPGHLEPINQYIFEHGKKGDKRVNIFILYDKAQLLSAVPDNGLVDVQVIGSLNTSQNFYGTGFVTILDRQQPRKRWLGR